jgi:hypothetical protein
MFRETTTTIMKGRLVDETMSEFDFSFSSFPNFKEKQSQTEQSICNLPWSPTSLKKQLSTTESSKLIAMGPRNLMWKSAPTLNFDPDEDDSLAFDEPDFNVSLPELTNKSSNASVKVKASELKVALSKEKEIKDLFTVWKQKKSKPVFVWSDLGNDLAKIDSSEDQKVRHKVRATSPRKQSPGKKVNRKVSSLLASSPNLNFNIDETFPGVVDKVYATAPSSPTKQLSPRKRKMVAVKLKASDLNLSDAKKKEIEDLFWQWKGEIKDPNSSFLVVEKPSVDRRWVDEEKAATRRPKPASRQRSASLEPTVERTNSEGEADVKQSTSRTNSSGKQEKIGKHERPTSLRRTSSDKLENIAEQKLSSTLRRISSGQLKESQDTRSQAIDAGVSTRKRSSSVRRGRSRDPVREKDGVRSKSQSQKEQQPARVTSKSICQDADCERSKSSKGQRGKDGEPIQSSTDAARERRKSRNSHKPKDCESNHTKASTRVHSTMQREK